MTANSFLHLNISPLEQLAENRNQWRTVVQKTTNEREQRHYEHRTEIRRQVKERSSHPLAVNTWIDFIP